MKCTILCVTVFSLGLFVYCEAQAERSDKELIAEAESAAPAVITQNAATKTMDRRVLWEGSNGWTCYPGTEMVGPIDLPPGDVVLGALMKKETPEVNQFSISYRPDPAALEGLSTDPKDPVYVMWKGTPYAYIMVKIAEEKSGG